jgi:hypothetical protein
VIRQSRLFRGAHTLAVKAFAQHFDFDGQVAAIIKQ